MIQVFFIEANTSLDLILFTFSVLLVCSTYHAALASYYHNMKTFCFDSETSIKFSHMHTKPESTFQ